MVPIVFALGSDPIKDGLVTNLNRPGGNITGATFFNNLLTAKRFELLHELVPNAKVFAILLNPKNANAEFETNEALRAASALGLQLILFKVITESDIDNSFASFSQQHIDALFITADAFFQNQREQIMGLARRNGIPVSSGGREAAVAGALRAMVLAVSALTVRSATMSVVS